jgi:hypothetical protein
MEASLKMQKRLFPYRAGHQQYAPFRALMDYSACFTIASERISFWVSAGEAVVLTR